MAPYSILLVFLHADYVKNINPNIKIRKQHICAGIAKKGVCHVRNLILIKPMFNSYMIPGRRGVLSLYPHLYKSLALTPLPK
jgi:hypothetical protein